MKDITSICVSLGLCVTVSSWSHHDIDSWIDEYAECAGDTQSPIDIDTYAVSHHCPITTTNEPTLRWKVAAHDAFRFHNNGHTIDIVAVEDGDNFGQEGYMDLRTNTSTIARFQNNFVTASNEHKQFCFHAIHFHIGLDDTTGSEHLINGEASPFDLHFVHFSCDYATLEEALAAEPEDPFVLGVIAIQFEIGEPNRFVERMINFNEYILEETDELDATVQYMFDLRDLIPNTISDFFYYKGSLTTPPCLEQVRWHIMTETKTVSSDQLERMREYGDSQGFMIAPNVRPPQINENSVYWCSTGESSIPSRF